jgi:hypothetical protein
MYNDNDGGEKGESSNQSNHLSLQEVFKGTAGAVIVTTIMKTSIKFQHSSVIANYCGSISYRFPQINWD